MNGLKEEEKGMVKRRIREVGKQKKKKRGWSKEEEEKRLAKKKGKRL